MEKDMNTFNAKKGEIEKNIDSLKDNFEKFMENYKEGKQKIFVSALKMSERKETSQSSVSEM